ncbi:S24/S26 family peptidase [Thermodesulfobacteriota bacterium]
MKLQTAKPALIIKKEGALTLSGLSLAVLLKAVLQKGLPFRFKAKGYSMSPFIKDGDVITVYPLLDKSPGLGSVVVYMRPDTGQAVVHRVIAKKGRNYRIQGDSTFSADGLIPKSDIMGLVRKVERNGKELMFGLGVERFLIALLIRLGFQFRFLLPFWRLIRPYTRRSIT